MFWKSNEMRKNSLVSHKKAKNLVPDDISIDSFLSDTGKEIEYLNRINSKEEFTDNLNCGFLPSKIKHIKEFLHHNDIKDPRFENKLKRRMTKVFKKTRKFTLLGYDEEALAVEPDSVATFVHKLESSGLKSPGKLKN